jgi:OPA family glycerol-3-phosphate transporter-like MFS transporter
VWLLAAANFFAYISRYVMIDWGPTYYREVKHVSLTGGGLVQTAIEFGGIPSTIFFGWISDRIGGLRGRVATLCMLPIIAALAVIAITPAGYLWIDYTMLFVIGCFIYPVINLITIAALDLVSKKAIGTAAGFIGLLGYMGKIAELKWIGQFVGAYSKSHSPGEAWVVVLHTSIVCAVIAALLLAMMWKFKPRA